MKLETRDLKLSLMLRSVAGIIVGYVVFAVSAFLLFRLTHVDPHVPASAQFEAFAIVYGMLFAMLGGYLGTAIGRKFWVAFTIACLIAAGAISSMVATGANWSPVAALVCMVPAAVVGGWLRLRQRERKRSKELSYDK